MDAKEKQRLAEMGKSSPWLVSWLRHVKSLPGFESMDEYTKEIHEAILAGVESQGNGHRDLTPAV